jgi:LDH2 family malate/lactate/ureidoglycolate dehydrogenase
VSGAEIRVDKDELQSLVAKLFHATGLDEAQASTIARHLVLANLRGVDSHGVSRVEIYIRRYEMGLMSKALNYRIIRESAASALIDGGNSSGIVLSTRAIELAVSKAKSAGIGIVGINHSNHCGMLADYTMYAAQHDCIALAVTNAPANMAPWGGKERFFGTNPFSYAFPCEEEKDVVLDMATSVVARGKMIVAQKNKQSIPLGWAITKDGEPTTDPQEALEGLVLPVGGYKGYGIALFVEALSGLFTGAFFGPHLADLYKDLNRPQNIGQCFIVMRADLFQPLDEFKLRMDQMVREIRQIPKVDGVERIYLPGEIEEEKHRDRAIGGIPLSPEILHELSTVAVRYGISSPLFKHLGEKSEGVVKTIE